MDRWLAFSTGFHVLGILFFFLYSSINFPSVPKKYNKIFYVDFVGASTVSNAAAKGNGNGGDLPKQETAQETKPAAQPQPEKKEESKTEKKDDKDSLKVPQQKQEKKEEPPKTAKQPEKAAEKNNTKPAAKTPAKTQPKKNTKPADKAAYLEAEDFSGSLPPPSMASAKGFLPEKKTGSKSGGGKGGEVSEGIGGGGFRTDTDFPYPWYISQVREALFNAWAANSPSASGLQCTVVFTILRNGGTKNSKIEKSSGNRLFDSAALAAVRAASPFSTLPDDFYEDVLTIHVEFRSTD